MMARKDHDLKGGFLFSKMILAQYVEFSVHGLKIILDKTNERG